MGFLPGLYTGITCRTDPRRLMGGFYLEASQADAALDRLAASTRKHDLWFSFAGGSTSWVRKRLLRQRWSRADVQVVDTSTFHQWDPQQLGRVERRRWYLEQLERSRFVLCPRGAAPSSIRLFETLRAGRVPVILSNAWAPPPFIRWQACAVRVPERLVGRLPEVLAEYADRADAMGRAARAEWERTLASDRVGRTVVDALQLIGPAQAAHTRGQVAFWPVRYRLQRWRWGLRAVARGAVLAAWRRTGRPLPLPLNRDAP
ncbi:MAG: exostosin [Puniceicoccaceae bacterium 5H]|nr:MAG: exostosin [Puniceicoccaceae bacterium 5H]